VAEDVVRVALRLQNAIKETAKGVKWNAGTQPPDPNAKRQIERFREMARELECDEDRRRLTR
jgi:hypothetical protein